SDIPALGRSFGETVSGGIRKTGDAIGWVAKNADLLKKALEALFALQALKIAIPLLADLTADTLVGGLGKLAVSLFGLGKIVPALGKIAGSLGEVRATLGLLVEGEGVATTA